MSMYSIVVSRSWLCFSLFFSLIYNINIIKIVRKPVGMRQTEQFNQIFNMMLFMKIRILIFGLDNRKNRTLNYQKGLLTCAGLLDNTAN